MKRTKDTNERQYKPHHRDWLSPRQITQLAEKMEELARTKYGLDPRTARRWSRWLSA